MRKLLRLATILLAFATLGFVGCEDPEEAWKADGIRAKVKSSTDTKITLEVETIGMSKIAWLATRTDNASGEVTTPEPVIIFRKGSQMEVSDGIHEVEVKNLNANATYNIYLVGEIAATQDLSKSAIVVENATTADFTQPLTVRDNYYRGFTLDVQVPASVKEEDHLIKWGAADLYLYHKNKYDAKGVVPDAAIVNLNDSDECYGQFFFNSSTSIVIDEEHSFRTNADGSIDEKTWLFESLVPGQPEVVIFGEFEYAQSNVGWGWGYYDPLFDTAAWAGDLARNNGELIDEAPYWDGLYHKELIVVKEPTKLDDSLLDVTLDIQTDDAIIDVTVDPSIPIVHIMVLDEEQHAIAYKWLGETYDYFQWFATSYVGIMEGATAFYEPENGRVRTALSEYLINVSQTSKYWVYVVGIRGDYDNDGWLDGHEQVCKHFEFNLKETTKPAPQLVVTALEPTEPNTAVFKVFCPTAAEGNGADKGFFISNYEKEWLASGMTAQELIDNYALPYENYYSFSSTDLDKINGLDGEDGLIIEFQSRPNENYHFAAMIANDEGSRAYSDAIICRTFETPVESVDSPYFESLKGEWTASATVRFKKLKEGVDTDDESLTEEDLYDEFTKTHTSNITIGDLTYPEVLPESAYLTYEKWGISREEADLYYEQFRGAADLFNETNHAQNRILMNGFNFAGEMLPYLPYFNYQSAYDLFVSKTYNGLSYTMPVYDFGPKWFLEVRADGSVVVPFNSVEYAPMGSWATSDYGQTMEIHLIAYEPTTPMAAGYVGTGAWTGDVETGYFPVEISEDGNTITIKPYQHEQLPGLDFYPNVGVYNGLDATGEASYSMSVAIISEITLTRGATAEPARVAAQRGNAGAPVVDQVEAMNEIKTGIRPRQRAVFGEANKVELVGPERNLTPEQMKQSWREMHTLR